MGSGTDRIIAAIGGPGAFAIEVAEADRFVESLVQKLVLEIAGAAPPVEAAFRR